MSFIAGYLLGLGEGEAVTEEIAIEKNGEYLIEDYRKDPAAVGWHKITANVPDRYDEGYNEGKNSVIISPLSVTENGAYQAENYGCDGFDPVNVNVPTYEQEVNDLIDFIRDRDGDDAADDAETIAGTFEKAKIGGENHTYRYKAIYTAFHQGGAGGMFGPGADYYDVTVSIYRDGEFWFSFWTPINARTEQGGEGYYGVDQFSKCFYWKRSDDNSSVYLYYRYFSMGSWESHNDWRKVGPYDL